MNPLAYIRFAVVTVLLAALVAAGMALRGHWIAAGRNQVQAKWDQQMALDQAESQRLAREVAADQLVKFRNTERIADEQATLEAQRAQRMAQLSAHAGRLRDALAAIQRRDLPGPSADPGAAACAGEARTEAELLGRCATEYERVATSAQELSDQVSGLQAYVAQICRRAPSPPEPLSTLVKD